MLVATALAGCGESPAPPSGPGAAVFAGPSNAAGRSAATDIVLSGAMSGKLGAVTVYAGQCGAFELTGRTHSKVVDFRTQSALVGGEQVGLDIEVNPFTATKSYSVGTPPDFSASAPPAAPAFNFVILGRKSDQAVWTTKPGAGVVTVTTAAGNRGSVDVELTKDGDAGSKVHLKGTWACSDTPSPSSSPT